MTKIQFLRNERGWSRAELARRAGVSDMMIHRIEKGTQPYGNFAIGAFYKISKALGVGLMDVVDIDRLE